MVMVIVMSRSTFSQYKFVRWITVPFLSPGLKSVISYDRRKALDAQILRFLAELRMTKRFLKQFIRCSLQILSFSKHLSHFNVNLDISELTYSSFLLFTLWWFQQSSPRLKKLIRVMFLFFLWHVNHVDLYLRGALECE